MPALVVVGQKVCTDGKFSLNDLTGSTGRLDVLLRCVNSAFMLSNNIRRNVDLYIVLMGEPDPPKAIHFKGDELKYLNPDERSTAALVKNALMKKVEREWVMSTPGIMVSRRSLADVLEDLGGRRLIYLKEDGIGISQIALKDEDIIVLGGKEDLSPEEEKTILAWPNTQKISVGPKSLHADHCITVVLNKMDNSS